MQKKSNYLKQRTLPWIGGFKEVLSQALWWGTVANALMLAATFYFTTLRYIAPWFGVWIFISLGVISFIVIYILEYKFITPSIWAFRSKQMFQYESQIVEKLDKVLASKQPPNDAPNKLVAVSGGFDPIHIGHLRYIQDAMKLGSTVIVILTRDDQLAQKKGKPFMCYAERKEIVEAILGNRGVVVPNVDVDITSVESIRKYKPNIFAKGGDTWDICNLPEAKVCSELGIEVMFGVGGFDKVQSSRWLIQGKTNV